MRQTDILIASGGLAGSTAAAMLARTGSATVLVDPHAIYPPDFRAEKLDSTQIAVLRKTGVGDAVLRAATLDGENARDLGQVIEEALPDLGIDRGVLGRRIGEHEGGGIDPVLRRGRRVGDHVAVRIGVARIRLELGRRQGRHGGNGEDRRQPREFEGPHPVFSFVRD